MARGAKSAIKFQDSAEHVLELQLSKLGLKVKDVAGDGALSDQLKGTPNHHAECRASVCNHLQENAEMYTSFLEENDGKLEEYVYRMRQSGVYGGNMEIVAFSRHYRVDVTIHQAYQNTWIVSCGEEYSTMLHIAYYSWEHYNSIRNINGPDDGLPCINVQIRQPEFQSPVARSKSFKSGPSSMEIMIIKSTGIDDLDVIRRMMVKYKGNPNAVIDELYENPEKNTEIEKLHYLNSTPVSELVSEVTNVIFEPNPLKSTEKPQRLSAREKKQQAKKTQKINAKTKKQSKDKIQCKISSTLSKKLQSVHI